MIPFSITPALLIYAISLCLSTIFLIYQWIYYKELAKAKRVIGFAAPPFTRRLVKITIGLLALTVCLSAGLFLLEILQ